MPSIRKTIPYHALKINGWITIHEGTLLPSYCDVCQRQSIHRCIGMKQDGQETLYRFECTVCRDKLGGKR